MIDLEQRIPVLNCIDVEPDSSAAEIGHFKPWLAYEKMHRYLSRWRSSISKKTGSHAHFVWFYRIDSQIQRVYGSLGWPLEHYNKLIHESLARGDEIGIHPRFVQWDDIYEEWRFLESTSYFCKENLLSSLQAYHQALGIPCRALRLDDNFWENELLDFALRQGIQYDVNTLQPEVNQNQYTSVTEIETPSVPFRYLNPDLYLAENGRNCLWIFPQTKAMFDGRFGFWYRLRKLFSDDQIPKNLEIHLSLAMDPILFEKAIKNLVQDTWPLCVVLVTPADTILNHRLAVFIENNIKFLLEHQANFIFSTPAEALVMLDGAKSEIARSPQTSYMKD